LKHLLHRPNLPLTVASAFLAVSIVALVALIAVRIHDQNQINQKICQSAADSRLALRTVLITSRDTALASVPKRNFVQRARIVGYYRPLIAIVPPIECVDGKPVVRK
jgi:hypothetical protein